MKTGSLFLICLLMCIRCMAQLPADFRSEQIYLNPDKHLYFPGDTVKVEGRVVCLSEKELMPYSRYLYVELFNEQDSVLLRKKLSCQNRGYFHCSLATDYAWPKGVYYLRAYTRLMCNFSSESFAFQPLLIGEKLPEVNERVAALRCSVVPSGGRLVAGHPQLLSVSLTDEAGFPVSARIYLQEESEDTLAWVQTSLSGLTSLRFIPQKGVRYWLNSSVDGADYRFPVPVVSEKVKVQGILNGQRLTYEVLNAPSSLDTYRLYLYDRERGLIELPTVKTGGIVMLDHVPQVLSIFLTDREMNILSEYTVAGKYHSQGALQAPESIRVDDSLDFQLLDLPAGSKVFARVIPENDRLAAYAVSSLNYLSDYVSPLPFPSGIFAEKNSADCRTDLLAWLSAAHFKRFSLGDAVSKDTAVYVHLPERTMGFGGKINKKSGHPFKGGMLVAYHTETDRVYDTSLDDNGRFYIAVDDFKEGDSFFLQAINAKGKPESADFHLDDETYPEIVNPVRFKLQKSYYVATEGEVNHNGASSVFMEGSDGMRQLTLPDITVKARVYADEESVETNRFYQTNYTDREKIEKRVFLTLYDILRDMPGVVLHRYYDEEKKKYVCSLFSSRGASTTQGNNELVILVDGTRINEDFDSLINMSAFEIESVELLRPWQTLAYVTGAINGAILVTTRGYKERPNLPSKGIMYMPQGLSAEMQPDNHQQPWVATEKGRYRLIVDVFGGSNVYSYEHVFEVN